MGVYSLFGGRVLSFHSTSSKDARDWMLVYDRSSQSLNVCKKTRSQSLLRRLAKRDNHCINIYLSIHPHTHTRTHTHTYIIYFTSRASRSRLISVWCSRRS